MVALEIAVVALLANIPRAGRRRAQIVPRGIIPSLALHRAPRAPVAPTPTSPPSLARAVRRTLSPTPSRRRRAAAT